VDGGDIFLVAPTKIQALEIKVFLFSETSFAKYWIMDLDPTLGIEVQNNYFVVCKFIYQR